MNEPEDPRTVGQFIVDVTVETLKGGADAEACTALVGRADRKFAATFERLRKRGARIACKSGCSFCCHLRVTVTAPEAIALLHYLKSAIPAELGQEIERRVLANADRIAQLTQAQHLTANVQCAFLINGACGAYRARPMACALHHSLDVRGCEKLYEAPADFSVGIRKLKVIEDLRAATHAALNQALEGLGLSNELVELNTAVAALIRDESLMQRWASGSGLL